jgi:hypothetical protein
MSESTPFIIYADVGNGLEIVGEGRGDAIEARRRAALALRNKTVERAAFSIAGGDPVVYKRAAAGEIAEVAEGMHTGLLGRVGKISLRRVYIEYTSGDGRLALAVVPRESALVRTSA